MFRFSMALAAAAFVACVPRPGLAQRATTPLVARWSVRLDQVSRRVPRWSATEVGLAGAFMTVLWVDAAQTRSLARRGWPRFRETNPLLGPRPSEGRINTYTAVTTVTTLGVAAVLPRRARRWWLAAAVTLEAYVVTGAIRSGVAFTVR